MMPLSLVLEDPVTAWELKKEDFFLGGGAFFHLPPSSPAFTLDKGRFKDS